MEHFLSPNSGEDQKKEKKRSSTRIEHFFPKFTRSDVHHSNYWGDAYVDHSQTIGGIPSNYWGGYIPPSPPCFGTPTIW